MLYAGVINLIADTTATNENGYITTAETSKEVFANVKSATRSEFYQALQSGITLSVVFRIRSADYGNERIVEYDGIRYHVERTYKTDLDNIELSCSEVKRE